MIEQRSHNKLCSIGKCICAYIIVYVYIYIMALACYFVIDDIHVYVTFDIL